MNHIYKVIFCKATGAFVAVAEFARAHGKKGSGAVGQAGEVKASATSVKYFALTALSGAMMVVSGQAMAGYAATGSQGSVYTNCNTDSIGRGSTNNGSIAIGGGGGLTQGNIACAPGTNDIAIGAGATAEGYVPGTKTTTGTSGSDGTKETGHNQAIAIGRYASAYGDQAVALGADTVAYGHSSIAIGGDDLDRIVNTAAHTKYQNLTGDTIKSGDYRSTKSANAAVAVGVQSQATGDLATAFGTRTTATGTAALAMGMSATASGDGSVAAGTTANATGDRAISIGTRSVSSGDYAVTLGNAATSSNREAIAIGRNAQASSSGGVALGSGSVANRAGITTATASNAQITAAGNTVYVAPNATTANSNAVLATANNTAAAVSVGGNGQNRQITNVAAGSLDSDAVNVAQLRTVTQNAATAAKTVVTAGTNVSVPDPTTNADGSTTYTVNAYRTSVAAAPNSTAVTVTGGTPDANNNINYNVDLSDAAKTSLGNADSAVQGLTTRINGTTTAQTLTKTNNVADFRAAGGTTLTTDGTTGITISSKTSSVTAGNNVTITPTTTGTDTAYKVDVNTTTLTPNATTGNVTAGNTAGLANANDIANAINNAGFTLQAQGANGSLVKPGATVNLNSSSPSLLTVSKNANGNTVNFDLSQTAKDGIAKGNTSVQTITTRISNDNGTSKTEAQTINQDQQYADFVAGDNITLSKADGGGIKISSTASATNNAGFNIAADNGDTNNVQLGETVRYTSADGNIITTVSDNQIDLGLAPVVTVGNTSPITIDGNNGTIGGLTNTDFDPNANYTGGQAATQEQVQQAAAASRTEVAAGTNVASVDKTQGANGQDIYTVNADGAKVTAGTGVNVEASDKDSNNITNYTVSLDQATQDSLGKADSAVQNIEAGENIAITREGNNITVATTKDLIADSLTTGDTVINNSGVTINNGNNAQPVTLTKDGLNNGGNKITNVAPGDISTDSTDAVNGSQLYTTNQNVANNADTIAKGFNIGADNGGTDNVQLGETINYTSTDGNIVTTVSNNQIDLGLAPVVTVGNTSPITIDGNNGTIGGLTNTDFDPTANYTGGQAATQEQVQQAAAASRTEVAAGTNVASVDKTQGANGQDIYTVNADGAKVTAGTGVNVEASDKDSNNITNYTVSLDQATQDSLGKADSAVQNIEAGENIAITREGNNITVATTKDLIADSLTTGDTVINNSGVTINNGNNAQPVTLTKDGLNNGGNKITNVAPGDISTDSTDAVNGSQLYTTNQNVANNADTIAKGFNIGADNGGTDNVQLGETINYTSTDGNIVTTVSNNQIDLGLAPVVTVGNTSPITIDGNNGTIGGLTNTDFDPTANYTGGQAATQEQVQQAAAASRTEVAAGTNVASVDKTQGANGQDIYTVNADGAKVTAGTGVNVEASDKDSNNITNYTVSLDQATQDSLGKADSAVQNIEAGENIAITREGNNITVATTKDLIADSLTTGDTVINNSGVTINNGNNAQPVTLTKDGLNNGGNKITNVAPGDISTDSTDAVNGSQLYTTNQNVANNADTIAKGFNISADNGDTDNVQLGETINYTSTDGNIVTTANNNQIDLGLAPVVTVGNTSPITIDGNNGTIGGLTNTDFDPNNIVSGQAATEDQLQQAAAAATTKLANGTATTVETTTNEDGSTTYKVNAQTDGTTLTVNDNNQLTAKTSGINAGNDGRVTTNEGDDPNSLVTAGNVTNAINNAGFNLQTNGDEASLIKNGDTVQLLDGQNIAITREGNNITVATTKDLIADSLTTGDQNGGAYIDRNIIGVGDNSTGQATVLQPGAITVGESNNGIRIEGDAGKINGLTNKTFDPNNIVSGQAATEDQLQQAAAAATTKLANGTATTVETTTNEDGSTTYKVNAQTDGTTLTVNDNNQLTAKTSGINAGNDGRVTTNEGDDPNSLVTAGNVTNAINNAGFNLQTNGDEASLIKNGDTVQLLDGQNIAITREGNNITVATTKDLIADSLTTGDSVVNNDGITINNGNNAQPVTLTKDGLNNGGNKITNVAPGDINADSTDAVNGSQLYTTNQSVANNADTIAKGFNISADNGNTDNVQLGETINYTSTDGNIVTTANNNQIDLGLAPVVTVGSTSSITIDGNNGTIGGLTNIDFDPNNIVSGQAATEDQLQQAAAAATTKLANGTATTVETTTNEDGSTTYKVNAQTDGTTLTVNDNNQLTAKTSGINAGNDGRVTTNEGDDPNSLITAGNVTNAINNAGFNLQTNGDEASLVKNGDTVQLLDGQNIAITREGNNITVATKPNVVFDSVKAGNTTINQDGIDNGGKLITNVASGLQGKTLNQIKDEGSSSSQWSNAATIGDLTQVQTNISNTQQIVGGVDIDGNVVDGDGSMLTVVNADNSTTPITLTAAEALRTYDAVGTGTVETNSVLTAVKNINEQGTKYIHFNGGERSVGGQRGMNDEQSQANGSKSTAIGYKTDANGDAAVAIGNQVLANGQQAIAIGDRAQALGSQSISIGTKNIVTGKNSGAIGDPSIIDGDNSYSIGNNNRIGGTTQNAFILGNNVQLGADNDGNVTNNVSGAVALGNNTAVNVAGGVALGENSVASRAGLGSNVTTNSGIITQATSDTTSQVFALQQSSQADKDAIIATATNSVGAVSVGREGANRQITNVAAGSLDSDAVNVAQLRAAAQAASQYRNSSQ
ncbi:ESPR-type extended signal peptide-containing protein [Faucicola atlantae]|uniref:ESPR-type extended signal peptide-containing protein n=1 Tax=Faucicola atlantae TaxID=34059 RepID=UPI0025B18939|nr:ESPR-type extended signal peptide-containing protein [Moraxella atlantae]